MVFSRTRKESGTGRPQTHRKTAGAPREQLRAPRRLAGCHCQPENGARPRRASSGRGCDSCERLRPGGPDSSGLADTRWQWEWAVGSGRSLHSPRARRRRRGGWHLARQRHPSDRRGRMARAAGCVFHGSRPGRQNYPSALASAFPGIAHGSRVPPVRGRAPAASAGPARRGCGCTAARTFGT